MPVLDKIGAAWHNTVAMWDKVGGVWHKTVAEWVKVGGVWRLTYDGLTDTYFRQRAENVGNLTGNYNFTKAIGAMTATVSGRGSGSGQNACQVGWIVENLPAGANVSVEWEYYKAQYAMNDILIASANAELEAHSEYGAVTQRTLTTASHTGWLLFTINFFPDYETTTWITIKKITVNGRQVWPAA